MQSLYCHSFHKAVPLALFYVFIVDVGGLWPTLNSASKQNRQGLCSISRDSLALSRKHTSRSSFFSVKRDSASSWPNQEKVKRVFCNYGFCV